MSFPETGSHPDIPAEKSLPELKSELTAIHEERDHFKISLEMSWPNIPKGSLEYLAVNCPDPALMPIVMPQLAAFAKADPESFADKYIYPLFIDDIIAESRLGLGDSNLENADEKITNLTDKTSVLNSITTQTAKLKGHAKLTAAREYLNDPNIPETIRIELTARFDQIEATLTSMASVLDDPASQTEFESIMSNTPFDLGAADMATAFAPIIKQVEASEAFTDEQKFKLRAISTGTDAQQALRETIIDEHGNIVPRFTENNKREFRDGVSGYSAGLAAR